MWFLSGSMFVCLLLAFGRHAPFYQFVYALPYASTIRNPAKFLHPFSFALTFLFAYGVHGLSRRYMETAGLGAGGVRVKGWWAKANPFDKRWVIGSFIGLGAAVLGWLIYMSMRDRLVGYLTEIFGLEGRSPESAADLARAVSGFSIGQVGWFILFLILSV